MQIPIATYRLQFNSQFKFKDAQNVVKYLSRLGISHIYASPIFKSREGSLHGYDIVDHNQLNPEIGTEEEFNSLIDKIKEYNMGWIQDIVPNHMAFDKENFMLMDILENGESSEFYNYFDIEWQHHYENFRGRILAPFLGKFYAEVLENGEIILTYDENGFFINYYTLKFPLKIESYIKVLTYKVNNLKKILGKDNPNFIKFLGIIYVLKNLPGKEDIKERTEQIKFVKKMLWELYCQNQEIKNFISENIKIFNGEKGNSESFVLLDNLLSEQLFKLSYWKVGAEEINYRRFFNINDLISLRIEDENVFNYTHGLVFKLVSEGKIDGLRIDHIDGLFDPVNYVKMLRKKLGGIYIVAEKILDLDENLPPTLQVHGTTGYDFLNYVNNIFCNTENEKKFDKIYSQFIETKIDYDEIVFTKKRLIIGKHMAGNIDNLAHLMKKISSKDRYGSDITLYSLRRALVDILACFPVYRTYINSYQISDTDSKYIKQTIEKAKKYNIGLLNEFNFIEKFLLLKFPSHLTEEEKSEWLNFVMKFQQYTAPLMAKGFEDTTLYVYNRLISLNEVGSKPNRFGLTLKDFHIFNKKRIHFYPHTMNTTSTHDTKRGEDVRARINVLSELPQEWNKNIKKWAQINKSKKKVVNGLLSPDKNDEYFIYQTLIGTYPFFDEDNDFNLKLFVDRIKSYTIKFIREAKVHTAWIKPDEEYETACTSFVEEILDKKHSFLNEFRSFQKKVAHYGIYNSLSQVMLKMTSPGIPDFYQGTELWEFSLVDPDNRQKVDYELRNRLLEDIIQKEKNEPNLLINELIKTKFDGRIKLFLIYKTLNFRKTNSDIFQKGEYIPLRVVGKNKSSIVSFIRKIENQCVIIIVPRLLTKVISETEEPLGEKVWQDTKIVFPEKFVSETRNVFTNEILKVENNELLVGKVLSTFPVAILVCNN